MTVDLHGPLEAQVFQALNADLGPALDWATVVLSANGFGVAFGLALAAAVWLRRPERRVRLLLALATAVSAADFLGARVLRPAFGRMRPCYALPPGTFRWLVPASDVGSLPSLHAANFFALATVAAAVDRRLGLAAVAVAAAVAWARVHGGVHWPSDVVAGAAWGALCGALARLAFLRPPRLAPAASQPPAPPSLPSAPPPAA